MTLRVAPSGRYLTDEDGKPVFWLGDTQWELLRLFTPENARRVRKYRSLGRAGSPSIQGCSPSRFV